MIRHSLKYCSFHKNLCGQLKTIKINVQLETEKNVHAAYLVEVFTGGSHFLPGLVEQLDADAEEFLKGAIVGEEHGVKVVAVFTGCGHR